MYGYIDDIGINYPSFNITGPTSLCGGQTGTYTVNTIPGVTTYTWQKPYNMNILSGQGTNSITLYAVSDFGGTLSVTPNCGTKSAKFTIMNINSITIDGFDQACPLYTYTFTAPYFSSADYDWSVTNGYVVSGQSTNEVQIALTTSSTNQSIVDLEVTGLCTNSIYGQKIVTHGDPPPPAEQCFSYKINGSSDKQTQRNVIGDILLYPNPTSIEVNIIPPNQDIYSLVIYDSFGRILYVKSEKILGKTTLRTEQFPAGIY